jgi:hypothetical protein
MKVANAGQLKQLLDNHGIGVDESGVARVKPAPPVAQLPAPMPNVELLQAIRELTAAVQIKEPPIVVQSPATIEPPRR